MSDLMWQSERAKDSNQRKQQEQVFDAAYDHDPQLPGRKGVIQAIMGRLWSESRGNAVVAVALSEARKRPGEADDENQPAKKLQRIEPEPTSSNRRSLRDALTAQIELDQTEAKKRRLDKMGKRLKRNIASNNSKAKRDGKGKDGTQGPNCEAISRVGSTRLSMHEISAIQKLLKK